MNEAAFADALAHEAARYPVLRVCPPEQTLATVAPALPAWRLARWGARAPSDEAP